VSAIAAAPWQWRWRVCNGFAVEQGSQHDAKRRAHGCTDQRIGRLAQRLNLFERLHGPIFAAGALGFQPELLWHLKDNEAESGEIG
jgi:hypothetical protein